MVTITDTKMERIIRISAHPRSHQSDCFPGATLFVPSDRFIVLNYFHVGEVAQINASYFQVSFIFIYYIWLKFFFFLNYGQQWITEIKCWWQMDCDSHHIRDLPKKAKDSFFLTMLSSSWANEISFDGENWSWKIMACVMFSLFCRIFGKWFFLQLW